MGLLRRLNGEHRTLGSVLTGVVALTSIAGATAIAVALLTQHHAPEPPLTAAPSPAAVRTSPPVLAVKPKVVGLILPASVPVAVSIPAINVQSTLLRLGRTAEGALAVPPPGPDYNTAGWYEYSPTPGALGPAVIAGHVDSAAEGPSVFFRLGGLHPGDAVRVTRTDGTVAVFTVDSVLRYSKTSFPTQLVYGNTDHAALRLITCGGPFDSATGHYVDNIVVFASLHARE